MPNWERDIMGFVPSDEWLDVGFNVTRPNDPVDGLFNDIKTDNIMAYWQTIAAEYQTPMMAQFHSFDTETLKTFRAPVDTHNIEKGLIKVKINQSERMRTLLRSGVREDALYDYVINDGLRLSDQVFTRSKVAKNELLASGKVTIKENNLDLTVDYGVAASQTAFTLDFSEEADITSQIQTIIDTALSAGKVITGIVTSRKNLTKMRKNLSLQKAINGTYMTGALVSAAALNAYLETEFGITTVITNDLMYGADAVMGENERPVITKKRYFPENKVTFFCSNPAGRLGNGLWGDPPEVDVARFMQIQQSGVSPYVYVSQWIENDPTVLWTRASGLFMPVLFDPGSLWIATVADNYLDKSTVSKMAQTDALWGGMTVADIQADDVVVSNGKITGTLKYVDSGALAQDWGAGNFIGLKLTDIDPAATSIKIGLEPSAGSGLQEIITDPDKAGVFKITNKNTQKFKVVLTAGDHETVQEYDLSGLTLQRS